MGITIAVHGNAEFHHPAQRGTLAVAVGIEGGDKGTVAQRAGVVHEQIVAAAKAHVESGAATWWSTDHVVTSTGEKWANPDEPNRKRKIVRYYVARSSVSVKFADFAALGDWAGELATQTGVNLAPVHWALTDATRDELTKKARIAAVTDGTERAAAYAAAAGLGPVRLIAVYEPGLRPAGGSSGASPEIAGVSMRGFAAPAGGAPAPTFELKPEDITVSASITLDFEA